VARGSGTTLTDVNRLLKQYRDMKKMMKTLSKPGAMDRFGKSLFPMQ
jgi:signal recognition particle subunit SRP54